MAIEPFELVVVNLYPFAEAAAREGITEDELIEQIDIGGPTLVRAAAKNHANVGIVTDPAQYDAVLLELGHGEGLTEDMRRELAAGGVSADRRLRRAHRRAARPRVGGARRPVLEQWSPTPARVSG